MCFVEVQEREDKEGRGGKEGQRLDKKKTVLHCNIYKERFKLERKQDVYIARE